MMPSPLALSLLLAPAHAGLAVDPTAPPRHLAGDVWDFGATTLPVLPAVVIHLEPGAAPPPGARPLGGRSWRLPVASPAAAVDAALAFHGDGIAFPDVLLPIRRMDAPFDDPHRDGQWYLDQLEMDTLYADSIGDPSVRVAILDSGIDIRHPDLVDGIAAPYDAFDDDDDPSPNPDEYCGDGRTGICDEHGTAVAGVVGARAGNGVDIVGMCPECTLIPVKLLGESQTGSLSENVRAFEHAIEQDAAVINNSWGFTRSIPVPDVLAEVIRRAHTEPRGGLGAVVVFAAGNDDREIDDDEMQAMPEVLCVSATDSYGRYTNYTNSGASVDVAAPSATVTLAPGGGITTTFGGTSAAAPVVSGLAAWALSVRPDLSADELQALIIDTAVPSPLVSHDDDGHHPVYGHGEIDAVALRDALLGSEDGGGADTAAPGEEKGGCATVPLAGPWLLPLAALAVRRRRR